MRVEADHAVVPWMRVGAGARIAHVEFGDSYDARQVAAGPHVTFDTRINPLFPRNAIHTTHRLGAPRLRNRQRRTLEMDARGYIGVGRGPVVALRGQLVRSDAALPQPEQSLLGGYDSLRGYRAGYRAGDSLAAVSAELRVPLNSPLRVSQFGVKGFIDAGTVWNSGTRLGDQHFDRGIGGGVFHRRRRGEAGSGHRVARGREAAGPFRDGSQFLGRACIALASSLAANNSVASLAALSAAVCA